MAFQFVSLSNGSWSDPTVWHTSYNITAINTGLKRFTISGNHSQEFVAGKTLAVTGSAYNDGIYTISTSTYSPYSTQLVVVEAIPSSSVNGAITCLTLPIATGFNATTVINGHTIDVDVVTSHIAVLQLNNGSHLSSPSGASTYLDSALCQLVTGGSVTLTDIHLPYFDYDGVNNTTLTCIGDVSIESFHPMSSTGNVIIGGELQGVSDEGDNFADFTLGGVTLTGDWLIVYGHLYLQDYCTVEGTLDASTVNAVIQSSQETPTTVGPDGSITISGGASPGGFIYGSWIVRGNLNATKGGLGNDTADVFTIYGEMDLHPADVVISCKILLYGLFHIFAGTPDGDSNMTMQIMSPAAEITYGSDPNWDITYEGPSGGAQGNFRMGL